MINREKIRAEVRALHAAIWKERRKLCPEARSALDLLNPAVAARLLGVKYEVGRSLGTFQDDGYVVSVAGLLDREAGEILISEFDSVVTRFTGAHEIGHWILHPKELLVHRDRPLDGASEGKLPIEIEADYFAAHFLMPQKLLKTEFAESFGVPVLEFDEHTPTWLGLQNSRTRFFGVNKKSLEREIVIAKADSYYGVHFRSLADRFNVSPSAMAIQLKEAKLVTVAKSREDRLSAEKPAPLTKTAVKSKTVSLLPTTSSLLEDKRNLKTARLVLLQHALRDTRIFIEEAIAVDLEVGVFVAKPNSVQKRVLNDIENLGVTVIQEPAGVPPYSYYEGSRVLHSLIREQAERSPKKKLLLVDVGGYFLKPLLEASSNVIESIAGVVEVTTFGHKRYEEACRDLKVPVLSIARSPLKDGEARFVGDSVCRAAADIVQSVGFALKGKKCLVIGYGMIGRQIAISLKKYDCNVVVFDESSLKMVEARLDGFEVFDPGEALQFVDFVFSSTGGQALPASLLVDINRDIFLFSGGSRAQEFDLVGIEKNSTSKNIVGDALEKYIMPSGNACFVANKGKAVNFRKDGTPEEAMDLVFAEMTDCLSFLMEGKQELGKILELPVPRKKLIAERWLRFQKNPVGERLRLSRKH